MTLDVQYSFVCAWLTQENRLEVAEQQLFDKQKQVK